MNVIASTIMVASVIFLIYALLMRWGRIATSEALQGEPHQRPDDENWQLTQPPEADAPANEKVTPSLTTTGERSRCPACGTNITANDERCPSCDIAFVADGSRKWTLGAVGPADGIFVPPTDVRE